MLSTASQENTSDHQSDSAFFTTVFFIYCKNNDLLNRVFSLSEIGLVRAVSLKTTRFFSNPTEYSTSILIILGEGKIRKGAIFKKT